MISSNYDSKAVYSSSKHGSHLSNFTDLESVSKISKKLINKTGISSLDKDDSEKTKGSGDGKTLPQILSLKGTNLVEAQIPLIAAIQDGKVILTKEENYPKLTTSLVYNYNPTFNFQFRQGSKVPLINVKQILAGEVKQYKNLSEAMKSAYLFKDLPLNNYTTLELQNKDLTYMVIEVQICEWHFWYLCHRI